MLPSREEQIWVTVYTHALSEGASATEAYDSAQRAVEGYRQELLARARQQSRGGAR